MKTSTAKARNIGAKVGKITMAAAVVAAIVGLGMTPAFGGEHDDRGADAHDRGHSADRGRQYYRPQRHYPYHYAQPVYAPPPAYYPAQPSPGITLFFPLEIR